MPAIESSIEAALFDRVRTMVLSPALPIAWPNITEEPSGPYIRVSHIPNTNRRLFIGGANPHERRGLLQLSIFMAKDEGPDAATAAAGAVAAHFPADLRLTRDGVAVRITKAPDIAQALPDGAYWHVPVTITYECFA